MPKVEQHVLLGLGNWPMLICPLIIEQKKWNKINLLVSNIIQSVDK
jgi:hypothetical protein